MVNLNETQGHGAREELLISDILGLSGCVGSASGMAIRAPLL